MLQVRPVIEILSQAIYTEDNDTLADTCWALSYLSDGPNDRIQAVIGANNYN